LQENLEKFEIEKSKYLEEKEELENERKKIF